MVRVDFYILPASDPDAPQRFACRLAEKAWEKGHRVFIHTTTPLLAQQMDELLWTYRQDSFLPHGLYTEGEEEAVLPVLVGAEVVPTGTLDVLINLAATVPSWFDRCNRVAEVVGGTEEARTSARERYRFYRSRGCSPLSHDLSTGSQQR